MWLWSKMIGIPNDSSLPWIQNKNGIDLKKLAASFWPIVCDVYIYINIHLVYVLSTKFTLRKKYVSCMFIIQGIPDSMNPQKIPVQTLKKGTSRTSKAPNLSETLHRIAPENWWHEKRFPFFLGPSAYTFQVCRTRAFRTNTTKSQRLLVKPMSKLGHWKAQVMPFFGPFWQLLVL